MEIRNIVPKKNIDAVVEMPGSKSLSQRALLMASLAEGPSKLEGVLDSDDTRYMIEALRQFGVTIDVNGDIILVQPTKSLEFEGELYVGNAGTAMRFLTGVAALNNGAVTLDGDKRMRERPIGDLVDALYNLVDGRIAATANFSTEKFPPVHVTSHGLLGGETNIKGDVSSQFLSSLLMVAPYARADVIINVTTKMTSKPYVDMTIDAMRAFGVGVDRSSYERFVVSGNQKYVGREFKVERDASSSSYFLAAAAVSGGLVRITGVDSDSVQGDAGFVDVLERMGCQVAKGEGYVEVRGPDKLNGVEVDMNGMPDTVQTLAAVAAFAEGETLIKGIGNLRVKETDRIFSLETELGKMGILTESTADSLTIYGGNPRGAQIETYGDHRMAMSMSVVGLVAPGVSIVNPNVVSKSFPEFWDIFERL